MADVGHGRFTRYVRGTLHERKYEFLLAALVQHLFVPGLLPNLDVYTRLVWPVNMVILGLFSVGIFVERSRASRAFKNVMSIVVVGFPGIGWFVELTQPLLVCLCVCYVAFFLLIFVEVMRYLLRPSYINVDIVSAAVCGFLLLLETSTFLLEALYYFTNHGFHGLDATSPTTVYLDLVYFCAIVLTSIGLGDIVPIHHVTKLATAAIGISGQMYSVVLVGILVSKYASATSRNGE